MRQEKVLTCSHNNWYYLEMYMLSAATGLMPGNNILDVLYNRSVAMCLTWQR